MKKGIQTVENIEAATDIAKELGVGEHVKIAAQGDYMFTVAPARITRRAGYDLVLVDAFDNHILDLTTDEAAQWILNSGAISVR